jgi:Family of unknown function (DUF5681)
MVRYGIFGVRARVHWQSSVICSSESPRVVIRVARCTIIITGQPPRTTRVRLSDGHSASIVNRMQMSYDGQTTGNLRRLTIAARPEPPKTHEAMNTEITAGKQRGRPFPKGRSGNPQGRPPGTRNAATVIAEQLLDSEAEEIIRKVIEKAKQGDMIALRLCVDRLVPPRRDRPVRFVIPPLSSSKDATGAMAAITTAVASGELTPTEAAELSRVIEGYVKALEATEIERRLRLLEERAIRGAK